MSNDVTKKQGITDLDNFSNFVSDVEGEDDAVSYTVILGTKIKFVDPNWYVSETDEVITGVKLTVYDVKKAVNKWGLDNKPLVTRILAPDEKWPNFAALNAECPQSEWREKFGKMVGPWAGQHLLYFLDEDYNRYTWPSPLGTIGSRVCVRETVDEIALQRRIRGLVYATVELGHKDWPTGPAGLKQRPYLLRKVTWVRLNPDRLGGSLLTPDNTPSIANTGGAPADAQPVEPVTLKEEMDDEIEF
jgi:hypothetical protein